MSSRKQFQALSRLFVSPNRLNQSSFVQDIFSKTFSSSQRHRKPIFDEPSFSNSNKKHNKIKEILFNEPVEHYEIRNILSDDFCGCQTTLDTCRRITQRYFNGVSLMELKNSYEQSPKPKSPISHSNKKALINQLPLNYPEIYQSQIMNLLDHFNVQQMKTQNFKLLAWIEFHCKFEYVTFYFYTDLKESLKCPRFYDKLELALLRYHLNFRQKVQYLKSLNLRIDSFLEDYHESIGATLIPVTQYAKFLELVKLKGQDALIQLISLFIAKKETELYVILKHWTHNEIQSMIKYSRFLNWDLFFQQIRFPRSQ